MSTDASTDATAVPRCFMALLPDTASRQALHRCRETLERSIAGSLHGVRWTEPAALHLTLRFLGTSGSPQIEYLKHMLPTLTPALRALYPHRYGIWPNRARPRLLVLELEADTALSKLACDCEAHARKAGFAPEPRDFRAHVTLARLRPGCAFGTLPRPSTPVTFDAVALMRSVLTQPAATYTELARAALPRNAPA
ncbi:MAG TPA: RNA 2',3'-cyclic phosphodiesterase [Rhodanobacteraceae bacterium]|nr:RNA 2',3'-cyclic phosphodiesterase [Rhodanobacteraceae bacterium]